MTYQPSFTDSSEFKEFPAEETLTRFQQTRIRTQSVSATPQSHSHHSRRPRSVADREERAKKKRHYAHCSRVRRPMSASEGSQHHTSEHHHHRHNNVPHHHQVVVRRSKASMAAPPSNVRKLPERTKIFQDLYNELQHWQNENDEEVKRRMLEYERKISQLESELEMRRAELDQQRNEVKMLVRDREELLRQLEAVKQSAARVKQEYEARIEELRRDHARSNQAKDDQIRALQHKIAEAEAEIRRICELKHKVEAELMAEVERCKRTAAEREEALKAQLVQLQRKIEAVSEELRRVQQQRDVILQERREAIRVINEMFDILHKERMTERDSMPHRLNEIRTALCEALQRARDLDALNRQQAEEARQRLLRREKEVREETARYLRDHYEAHLNQLRRANETLKAEIDACNAANAALKREKDALLQQNEEDARKFMEMLNKCNAAHASDKAAWDLHREKLELELRAIRAELQEYMNEIAALEAQIKKLIEQLRQAEKDLASVERQARDKESALHAQLRRVGEECLEIQKRLKISEELSAKYQTDVANAEHRCKALQQQLNDTIAADKQELRAKEVEIDRLTAQLRIQQAALDQSKQAQARVEAEHAELIAQIEQLRAQAEVQKTRADRFEDLVASAKRDLAQYQEQAKGAIDAATADARRSEAEKNQRKLQQLGAELNALAEANSGLKQKALQNQTDLTRATQDSAQLAQGLDSYKNYVANADKATAQMMREVEAVKKQNADLRAEKAYIEQEKARIVQQSTAIKLRVHELEAQVDKLEAERRLPTAQQSRQYPFSPSRAQDLRAIETRACLSYSKTTIQLGGQTPDARSRTQMYVTAEFMDKLRNVDRDARELKQDLQNLIQLGGAESAELRDCERELLTLLDRLGEISNKYSSLRAQNESNFEACATKKWIDGFAAQHSPKRY